MAKQKQKVTVPGLVGWTLLDTAKHHGLLTHCTHADSPWDYNTFGEGPMSAEDHVVVSRDFFDKTGPMGYQEKNVLKDEVPDDVQPTCAASPLAPRPRPSPLGVEGTLARHVPWSPYAPLPRQPSPSPAQRGIGSREPRPASPSPFSSPSPAPSPSPSPALTSLPPSPSRSSRLASCVTLTKELDGIIVIVPDTNPDLTNYT